MLDSLRLPCNAGPYFTAGFPLQLPLEHGSRIASFERETTVEPAAAPTGAIVSDTKQLIWHGKPGVVAIDTERTQALVGYLSGRAETTRHLAVKLDGAGHTLGDSAGGGGDALVPDAGPPQPVNPCRRASYSSNVATRKKIFSAGKEVKAIARERVGTVPAARPIEPKSARRKPKHKQPIDPEGDAQ